MNESTKYYDQMGASEAGRSGAQTLKTKVGEAVEPMKEKVTEKVTQAAQQQKEAGAGHLQMAAQAVHGAACEFEQQMPRVAELIHSAGDQIDKMATNMRDKSLEEIVNSIRDFARQQPALVFGGALLAGLVLSRFLKSSPNNTANMSGGSYKGSDRSFYKSTSAPSYDTSAQGDYGVAAGRHYNEETPRPN
jgi:hypothetical protein